MRLIGTEHTSPHLVTSLFLLPLFAVFVHRIPLPFYLRCLSCAPRGNKSNLTRRTDASRSSLPPDLSLSLLLFHGRVQFARTTNLQVDEMEIELSESLATIRVKRVYKSSHDLSDSHFSTIPTNVCGDALFQLVPPNEPKLVQQKTNGHVPHRLVESPSENCSAWDSPSLMDRRCRRDGNMR
jgi:hypothetical protein